MKPASKSAARLLNRAGETMQDATDSCGAPDFFDEREAIGPGVATVDDDGKFGVAGERHLVAEYLVLDVAWGMIVKIIQSNFAPGDYFGMFCELRRVLRGAAAWLASLRADGFRCWRKSSHIDPRMAARNLIFLVLARCRSRATPRLPQRGRAPTWLRDHPRTGENRCGRGSRLVPFARDAT